MLEGNIFQVLHSRLGFWLWPQSQMLDFFQNNSAETNPVAYFDPLSLGQKKVFMTWMTGEQWRGPGLRLLTPR
jgi:hypothetical protein